MLPNAIVDHSRSISHAFNGSTRLSAILSGTDAVFLCSRTCPFASYAFEFCDKSTKETEFHSLLAQLSTEHGYFSEQIINTSAATEITDRRSFEIARKRLLPKGSRRIQIFSIISSRPVVWHGYYDTESLPNVSKSINQLEFHSEVSTEKLIKANFLFPEESKCTCLWNAEGSRSRRKFN